jgi:hypothetical protein
VILLFGCRLLWVSKLQTEVALSTIEAEYIALSQAMRDVIVLINILEDIRVALSVEFPTPTVKCTAFEGTKNQLADIFTKALPLIDLARLRLRLLGW